MTNLFLDDILLSQLNKNIVRRQQVENSINQKGACRGKEHEKINLLCFIRAFEVFCFIAHTKFIKRRES